MVPTGRVFKLTKGMILNGDCIEFADETNGWYDYEHLVRQVCENQVMPRNMFSHSNATAIVRQNLEPNRDKTGKPIDYATNGATHIDVCLVSI